MRANPPRLYFWRDNVGNEVDLLFETSQGLQAVEIKSGSTFASDWPRAATRWRGFAGGEALEPWIIYGGTHSYEREGCRVIAWQDLRHFP
jgi:uncharacterized protein